MQTASTAIVAERDEEMPPLCNEHGEVEPLKLDNFKDEREGLKLELTIYTCPHCRKFKLSSSSRDNRIPYQASLVFSAPGRNYSMERIFFSLYDLKMWLLNWGNGPYQFLNNDDFQEREMIKLKVLPRMLGQIADEMEKRLEREEDFRTA